MPLGVKHNLASVSSLHHLTDAHQEVSKTVSHLASGLQIIRASDAPADLMISEQLRAQIASMEQALQNTELSVSLVQTAEGALGEVSNMLIEMRQIATSAANEGVNDNSSMTALQLQIRSALEGIDHVSRFTRFGRKSLLDGSQGTTGTGGNEDLSFIMATGNTRASPIRGYTVDVSQKPLRAILSESIDNDDAQGLQVILEEEDGGLIRVKNPVGGTAAGFANRLRTTVMEANMNLDVRYDPDSEDLTIEHHDFGLAKGFTVVSSKDGILTSDAHEPELYLGKDIEGTIDGEDAEGDGAMLTGHYKNINTSGLKIAYTGDDGGNVGTVTVAQNALEFQTGTEPGDKIRVAINSTHSSALGRGVDNLSGFQNLSQIELNSPQNAIDAIRLVDEAVDQLSSMRGQLGSVQKYTLQSNISALRSNAEGLISAESAIRDADIAYELVRFTKQQIMVEAAAAAVAQANQTAARVMRLLLNSYSSNHWSQFMDN